MTCPRHNLPTKREHNLCRSCFDEARAVAEARLLEAKIGVMRDTSVDALVRRLRGK